MIRVYFVCSAKISVYAILPDLSFPKTQLEVIDQERGNGNSSIECYHIYLIGIYFKIPKSRTLENLITVLIIPTLVEPVLSRR